MPLLHIQCDTRVERSVVDPKVLWCDACGKEVKASETYRVGKRFFAGGAGAMLLAVAALSTMPADWPAIGPLRQPPRAGDARDTFTEMQRQKRRKLKGLKMQQRKHTSHKRRKK